MNRLCIVTYVLVFGDISFMGGGMALGVSVSPKLAVLVGMPGSLAEYDLVKLLGSAKGSRCESSVSVGWGLGGICGCGELMNGASSGAGGIDSGAAILAKYQTTMAAKANRMASATCVMRAMCTVR